MDIHLGKQNSDVFNNAHGVWRLQKGIKNHHEVYIKQVPINLKMIKLTINKW